MKLEHVDRLHDAELEISRARRAAHDHKFHQVMPSLAAVLQPLLDGLHEMVKVMVEDAAPEGYFDDEQVTDEPATEQTWTIWMEGYAATGQNATAVKLGEAKGATFAEACRNWVEQETERLGGEATFNVQWGSYDAEDNTIWGCHLHSSEAEARRVFG